MSTRSVYALALLLALATLDEGGSAPTGLLVWHALLAILLGREILARPVAGAIGYTVALGPRIAFALYAALVLVGALFAPYGFAAWLYTLEVAAVAGLAWLAGRAGPALLSRLALPLLAVATCQGVALLLGRFVLGEARPAASFLNANHLASWLIAALLLAWGERLVSGRVGRSRDALYVAMTMVVTSAVAVTGSRGALVGLLAGALVVFVLAWPSLARPARRVAAAGFALLLLVAAGGVSYRLAQSDPFRYQRVEIWRASLDVVAHRPILGAGPGQFRTVARAFQFPDGDGPLRFDRGFATTHSDLLRVPCELGIPGLAAALALVGTIAYEVGRRRSRGTLAPSALGAAGALAALGAHALVENVSSRSALLVLAAVLAGGLLSTPLPPADGRRGAFGRAALAVLLGLTLVVGDVAPYLAWRELRGLPRGRLAEPDAARLDRALAWNPIHPDAWRRRAEHWAGDGTSWDLEDYARAREAAEHAVRLDPAAAEFRLGLARVEATACRTLFAGDGPTRARMARAYDAAIERDPLQALWPLEQAEAALDCGDPEVAVRSAQRTLDLEPESATPRLVLAGALLRQNGRDSVAQAKQLLSEAERRAAEWQSWITTSIYARRLLALDSRLVERVRREIAADE